MKSTRTQITILFLLYVLMFWADVVSYRPGMDSMTYGAVAKHMLTTGDWAVPHYTTQAYSNFFQHPPLALWMMAITMKVFGTTGDWVLKLLPALMGGLCAFGVYLWGRRIRGANFAFVATLVLLTSTRFAKYSKGFMLDPFLATFSLWAVYFACRSRMELVRGAILAAISGLLVSAAFLSKGLFAFAPLSTVLFLYGIDVAEKRSGTSRVFSFIGGLLAPVLLWFLFGDAANYLSHYYAEHVAGRLGGHSFREHLGPLYNLAKVYWPWLPFFIVGLWKAIKVFHLEEKREETAIAFTAIAFIGGFTLVASFLEQYHTATYPFAALVAAMGIPTLSDRGRKAVERVLLVVSVAFLFNAVFRPYSMQGTEHKNPIRIILKEARARCTDSNIQRIAISTGIAEIWYALAMGSWNTDWDPYSTKPDRTPEESGAELLLAARSDVITTGWVPSGVESEGLRIYRSARTEGCR